MRVSIFYSFKPNAVLVKYTVLVYSYMPNKKYLPNTAYPCAPPIIGLLRHDVVINQLFRKEIEISLSEEVLELFKQSIMKQWKGRLIV